MKTTPYTLCFLHDASHVLLLDRAADRVELPGMLNGLGGKLHAGEDPEAAARREIREEAGVIATDLRFRGTESWVCHDDDESLVDQGTLYLFISRAWRGEIGARCPEGELIWLPIADALTHPRLAPNLTTILPALLEKTTRRYCGVAHYRADDAGGYRLLAHGWSGW